MHEQVSQAVPTLPPQSAAQKAITKARKEATLKAASTNTQEPSAAFPSQRPSEPAELQPSLGLAAVTDKKSSAKAMAGTAAQKRSDAADLGKGRAAPAQQSIQLEVKAKPAQLKPAEPVARLIGESKELAAMEADFLKTLAETRELQQAFSAAMASADGSAGSGPGTRLGSQAPLKMSEALKSSVAYLLASLISESRRFDELHKGWRVMPLPPAQSEEHVWKIAMHVLVEAVHAPCNKPDKLMACAHRMSGSEQRRSCSLSEGLAIALQPMAV